MKRPDFQVVRPVDGSGGKGHDPVVAREQLGALTALRPTRDLEANAKYFILDSALQTAINTALVVGAPLLLTGEPGTGKTQVAHFLKWYFGIELFAYYVKSTSTGVDLLYDFDAVAYLHQAQSGEENPKERSEFLIERPLWQAYNENGPSVLLIDEIDKAPRDFPNDLLHELDQGGFPHPFKKGVRIQPKTKNSLPLIVITSNAERRLPDPFLRRCVVHHLRLDDKLLERIVMARRVTAFPDLANEVLDRALERFRELREIEALTRRPSTAELLAWLAVLSARGTRREELDGDLARLPSLGALIKDHQDLDKL